MTHIIIKLVTGAVVFGTLGIQDEGKIVINKPYTFIVHEGLPSLAPYDAYAFQGEVSIMTFPMNTVLQYSDFAECTEARDAYISITSGIVLPNQNIII